MRQLLPSLGFEPALSETGAPVSCIFPYRGTNSTIFEESNLGNGGVGTSLVRHGVLSHIRALCVEGDDGLNPAAQIKGPFRSLYLFP